MDNYELIKALKDIKNILWWIAFWIAIGVMI